MDNREIIINEVMINLQSVLNETQLRAVSNILYIQLNKYEIQERTTEITIADNSPDMALKKFIATKRIEGKSEKTLEQYTLRCSAMLHTIGKKVDEITTYDLRFYLAEYQKRRGVSNRTLENIRQCIMSFFSWLSGEGLISTNPAAGIGTIKYEKQVRKPFSPVEIEEIRRACKNKRDRAIVEFLYATGCRVSEVVSLNRSDINWNNKNVIVRGKGNKQRIVYLNDVALLYLQEYMNSRNDCDSCLFASERKQKKRLSPLT